MLRKLLFILAMSLSPIYPGNANALHLLELDRFSFEVANLYDRRDYYFYYYEADKETWSKHTAVNFDLDLLTTNKGLGLKWQNKVFGNATDKQYRETGWLHCLQLQPTERLILYWRHESRHLLDAENGRLDPFPLTNYIGAEFVFYKRP